MNEVRKEGWTEGRRDGREDRGRKLRKEGTFTFEGSFWRPISSAEGERLFRPSSLTKVVLL